MKKPEKTDNITQTVYLDPAGKHEPNFVWVAVNGRAWQIPKGKAVTVPWFVAEELRRSQRAARRRDDWVRENSR